MFAVDVELSFSAAVAKKLWYGLFTFYCSRMNARRRGGGESETQRERGGDRDRQTETDCRDREADRH